MQPRRAVLLAILAVALSLLLIDAHGSPRQAVNDLREVVSEGGFRAFRRAAETPFNLIFEARP